MRLLLVLLILVAVALVVVLRSVTTNRAGRLDPEGQPEVVDHDARAREPGPGDRPERADGPVPGSQEDRHRRGMP